jgi:hypothetical protein
MSSIEVPKTRISILEIYDQYALLKWARQAASLEHGVTVFKRSDNSFMFKCFLRGKFYLVHFVSEEVKLDKWLIAKRNMC